MNGIYHYFVIAVMRRYQENSILGPELKRRLREEFRQQERKRAR